MLLNVITHNTKTT